MNDFDLTGKTAIVTGGRNGNMGPIITQVLKDYGVNVYTFDRDNFDTYMNFDITNEENRKIFFKLIETPDIIVCNAAIDNPPHTEKKFFDDFEKIMQVNLEGHIKLIEMFLPDMIKKGGGVIIFIGSIMGYIGANYKNYPDNFEKPVAYNCSKWAYKGLAKSLGVQYGRYGIRAICPGFGPVDTGKFQEPFKSKILDTIPMGKLITPKSIRQTILYACCCEELTGQDWLIDGGYTAW